MLCAYSLPTVSLLINYHYCFSKSVELFPVVDTNILLCNNQSLTSTDVSSCYFMQLMTIQTSTMQNCSIQQIELTELTMCVLCVSTKNDDEDHPFIQ